MSDITTGNFVCIEQTPANVGDRIVGRIIDLVLISVYLYAAGTFLRHTPGFSDDVMQGIYVFLVFLPALAYTFLSELLFDGQTVGKYAMKTRVVMADGSSPTAGALFLRYVCEIVDIWMSCLGLVFILATRRHQRLGDLAAGTMVIRQTDMSRMHISLGEFAYARRGYKPTYDNAAQLSPHQADILRRTVAPDAKASDERIERIESLAAKVARVMQLPANADWGNSREFLTTVLNDYLYLTTQNRS